MKNRIKMGTIRKNTRKFSFAAPLLAFAALFCLFPILLLLCGLVLPAQYEETFLGEMKYKLKRLQETGGKRIILTGGSNIPFGVKSELLAEYFPEYDIVDFGMYADMGTVVMLDFALAEVHEGDIFIIMPEQNAQTLSCHFSGEDVWQAADGALNLIPLLSPKRYEQLAASFPVFAGKKFFYAINGEPKPDGVYSRSSFNEYGDIAYPDRGCNTMSGGFNPNDLISFEPTVISEDFVEEMNAFALAVREKGASVYYHFPPMNEQALESSATKTVIDAYYDALQRQLTFPLLGNPHRSILESGWFYDTNFHLNDSGAIVFTKYLIEDLKLLFRDTSPTDIAPPKMPEASVFSAEGDNSCADCFTYRREPDGWLLEGLTEKGQSSAVLVIPASYEDAPVIAISETLFAENTVLQELTVQPNIGILYDGMFRGCSSLKKLILSGEPTSYRVGSALMEGADFLIYVPEETTDSYKRDYSWQKYGAYIQPYPPKAGP